MKCRGSVAMVVAVGFLGVVSGCAARTETARASTAVAAQRPSQQLSGTWQGSFSKPGASIYADEGKCVLDIRPDGTFTASVTPNPASNSHAKAESWSGTVAQRGDRLTFRTAQGPAPSLKLNRSGDALYGILNDPATEWDVLVKLQRVGTGD